MKEHPILFQTEMIRAILDGRKVMTRRIVKNFDIKINEFGKIDYSGKTRFGHNCDLESINDKFLGIVDKCPYGNIGDTLWVRETWCTGFSDGELFHYKASDPNPDEFKRMGWTWRPSIFMPRAASRITLKITNIKVERVQDISEEDAIKEGVQPLLASRAQYAEHGQLYRNYFENDGIFNDGRNAQESFQSLWIKINGQESWDSNPFCWCVEFEKL